ncbi:alpha/beta hydrolase [soil metagenome]
MPDFYNGGHSGSGPEVVLIHGAGCNHTVWRYQTRFFANRGFRVKAFDLPGHGSNRESPLDTVEEMAEWVADRIEGRTAVIGHSLGGLVALELARTHPLLVERLALLGCGRRIAVHPELQGRAGEQHPASVQMIVGWSYDIAGRIGGHPEPGTSPARVTSRLVESEIANLGRDLRATATYKFGEEAAKGLEVEALVVAGGRDRMVSATEVIAVADSIKGATFTTIPAAGHFMMTDSPDPLRSAICSFLPER